MGSYGNQANNHQHYRAIKPKNIRYKRGWNDPFENINNQNYTSRSLT